MTAEDATNLVIVVVMLLLLMRACVDLIRNWWRRR
jgi:hypothetical protein